MVAAFRAQQFEAPSRAKVAGVWASFFAVVFFMLAGVVATFYVLAHWIFA